MRPVELSDLARIRVPLAPARVGRRLVYPLKEALPDGKGSRCSLWALPLSGGEPVRLTRAGKSDRDPVALGEALLFVSDRERGEQLWRLDEGEPARLSSFPPGELGAPLPSPDGRTILVLFTPHVEPGLVTDRLDRPAGEEGPTEAPGPAQEAPWTAPEATPRVRVYARPHLRTDGQGWDGGGLPGLWLVDVATGAARRLTRGPWAWAAAAWSPDGRAVWATRTAPAHDRRMTANQLVRIEIGTGEVEVLHTPAGNHEQPAPSPDGRWLAVGWADAEDDWGASNAQLLLLDLVGGGWTLPTTPLDRPVGDHALDDVLGCAFTGIRPVWDADSRRVTATATDGACTRILHVGVDGALSWGSPATGCAGWLCALPDGALAGVWGEPGRLPELARFERDGAVTPLTRHNAPLHEEWALPAPEAVAVAVDGVRVEGFYRPGRRAEGARGPLLLYIHGGPHGAYGARFFFEMAWLAAQGFSVVWGNPRGSHGYGEAFARAIVGRWGEVESADLLALVEAVASRPENDPERVGVTGGSYGGYMTLHLTGTTRRFRAAASDRGLYDWGSDVGGSDFGHAIPELLGAVPWREPHRMLTHSSIQYVEEVACPYLVLHGEGDLRCNVSQALLLHEALSRVGVPTALVLYPEESHGMTRGGRLDRRQDRMKQLAAWFGRYL